MCNYGLPAASDKQHWRGVLQALQLSQQQVNTVLGFCRNTKLCFCIGLAARAVLDQGCVQCGQLLCY
jgi:hypothetical protein